MRPVRLTKRCLVITFFLCLYLYTRDKSSWGTIDDEGQEYDKPEQLDWQPVTGSNNHFSIYSAYSITPSEAPEVLIIGVTKTFTRERIICQYHFKENSNDKQKGPINAFRPPPDANDFRIPGRIHTMKENWRRPYSGVFIRCPSLPSSGNRKPDGVSILLANETKPSNMILINYQHEPKTQPYQYNFTFSVCVLPSYNYNEVFHLLEWIEFYKMMGVEQFTLYNVSIGPDASCVLQHLMEGADPSIKVNVHPWHKNPVKTFGQIRGNCAECSLSAGSNDCLYRHRGRLSKYMAFVDLDEFLMPRQDMAKNFLELVDLLDSQNPGKRLAQYLFRNGFFILSRPDDPMLLERCSSFLGNPLKYRVCREAFMMKKTVREDYQKFPMRSKYIIKPERVRQAGNHYVYNFELSGGYSTVKVSKVFASLRHYRQVGPGNHTPTDRIPLGFGLKFVENLAKKVEYFKERCYVNLDV